MIWIALATQLKSYTEAVLPNGSTTCSYSSVRRDLELKVAVINIDACEGGRASWRYALDKSHTLPNKLDASSKDQSGCNGPSSTLPSDSLNDTRRVSGSTAERTPLISPAMTSTPPRLPSRPTQHTSSDQAHCNHRSHGCQNPDECQIVLQEPTNRGDS